MTGRTGAPGRRRLEDLASGVIDAERCIGCGVCVAACLSRSLVLGADGHPKPAGRCAGCSACWDLCPRGGAAFQTVVEGWAATRSLEPTPEDETLGPILAAYEARARQPVDGAQDGGVVTTLLSTLLDRGFVQGALVTRKRTPVLGEAILATRSGQVRESAGSVYSQSYPLASLTRALPEGIREIALVGTPCQIAGLRALQCFPWRHRRLAAANVTLTVGLFCTRSFDGERLTRELVGLGADLERVAKVDVRGGWLRTYDADGTLLFEERARSLRAASLLGCAECGDFAATLADISVGNVGSSADHTTVLIRTERGAEAWVAASDVLEVAPLPHLEAVVTQAERKAAGARAAAESEAVSRPVGSLWAGHAARLAAYARR